MPEKKKISRTCNDCNKKYTPKKQNFYISLDVGLQIEKIPGRKDVQKSYNLYLENEKNKTAGVMTDITDSALYKKILKVMF